MYYWAGSFLSQVMMNTAMYFVYSVFTFYLFYRRVIEQNDNYKNSLILHLRYQAFTSIYMCMVVHAGSIVTREVNILFTANKNIWFDGSTISRGGIIMLHILVQLKYFTFIHWACCKVKYCLLFCCSNMYAHNKNTTHTQHEYSSLATSTT